MTSDPKRLRTLLVGAGSLGRAFLRRLRDRGGPIELVGIVTAHHGRTIDPRGIDAETAVDLVETQGLGADGPDDVEKLIEMSDAQVLIECIPQNIRSGDPALAFHRAALDRGVHVVTSNKAPIVLGYRDLLHRAAKSGAQFRFEATTLDGLPIFQFVKALEDVNVTRVRGVLNGTSSVVLESVALGSTRSRGLARAQAQGIAEADSVLDLDGWDAASKAALLANVWMGGALRVVDVARTGCETMKDDRIREAAEGGARYKLVAEIERSSDGNVRASVEPIALESGDPLFSLKGPQGGVIIDTDVGHSFTLLQKTSGLDDAAFGLINDVRAIINGVKQV
ncbi:MAG: hypothetical protein RMA76_37485 [Deltaproteobacteria bacterium]